MNKKENKKENKTENKKENKKEEELTKEDIEYLKKIEDQIPEHLLRDYIYYRWLYDYNFFEDFFFLHFKEKDWKIIKEVKFHKEMKKDLMSNKNLLWIMFRWSWKTTKVLIYIIWCIVYKRHNFITFYSFDKNKAKSKIFWLVSELVSNKKIKTVYWDIYPLYKLDKEVLQKRSIAEFITLNWVKVKAFWIWESPRWEIHVTKEWVYRPELIVLDDIDVEKSVQNIEVINKNYEFLKWEVFWWLDINNRIIFLWNIIKEDWLVPRFEKEFKNDKNWIVRKQPLIENWKIVWRYFTKKKTEEIKKNQWEIAFNQNYLLIPYKEWDTIIWREYIKTMDNIPDKLDYYIWIDPAISEKTKSDSFWIVIVWHDKTSDLYYVVKAIELKEKQKQPFTATQIIKQLYNQYKAKYVIVETVAFQKVMSDLLKREWIATKEVKPVKDKITRLMEKQYLFEQWKIIFKEWETNNLIEQLVSMPNVKHDDLVDAMVYALEFIKKPNYDVLLKKK